MELAVNDMDIYEHITPEFLRQRMDFINHADLVVTETNLPAASLQWLCQHCAAPILADPVSTIKAPKLAPVLGKLTALKPNRMEAELLSGVKIETAARRAPRGGKAARDGPAAGLHLPRRGGALCRQPQRRLGAHPLPARPHRERHRRR